MTPHSFMSHGKFYCFLIVYKISHNRSLALEPLILKCPTVKKLKYLQFNGYYKSCHQLIYKSQFSTYYLPGVLSIEKHKMVDL